MHLIWIWTFSYNKVSGVTASYGKLLGFIAFFRYFHTFLTTSHVWSALSWPNFHGLCVKIIHTFWYVDMLDVTTSYERFSGLIGFFGNCNVRYVMMFIELSWILWKANDPMKVLLFIPFNHLDFFRFQTIWPISKNVHQ